MAYLIAEDSRSPSNDSRVERSLLQSILLHMHLPDKCSKKAYTVTAGNGSSHRGLSHELNALDLEDGPQAHLAFDQNHNLGARLHSPGSLNGSLIVEPTEASSAHDNASVDGSARGITESRYPPTSSLLYL